MQFVSRMYLYRVELEYLTPLRKGLCSVPDFDIDVCTPVIALFFNRGPPAIIRAIVTIVVNAVNGQIILISVGHGPIMERNKIRTPFLAYLYATSAVSVVSCIMFIITPCFHVLPDVVNPCSPNLKSGLCKLPAPIAQDKVFLILFLFQATTRANCAALQAIRTNNFHISTVTLTDPIGFSRFRWMQTDYNQSAKSLPS